SCELAEVGAVLVEVPAAVEQHERADAGDDEREHPSQHIHVHREIQAELRNPLDRLERRAVFAQHLRRHDEGLHECRGRNERSDGECLSPQPADQRGQNERPEQEHSEEQQHGRLLKWHVGLTAQAGGVCPSLPAGRAPPASMGRSRTCESRWMRRIWVREISGWVAALLIAITAVAQLASTARSELLLRDADSLVVPLLVRSAFDGEPFAWIMSSVLFLPEILLLGLLWVVGRVLALDVNAVLLL